MDAYTRYNKLADFVMFIHALWCLSLIISTIFAWVMLLFFGKWGWFLIGIGYAFFVIGASLTGQCLNKGRCPLTDFEDCLRGRARNLSKHYKGSFIRHYAKKLFKRMFKKRMFKRTSNDLNQL